MYAFNKTQLESIVKETALNPKRSKEKQIIIKKKQ